MRASKWLEDIKQTLRDLGESIPANFDKVLLAKPSANPIDEEVEIRDLTRNAVFQSIFDKVQKGIGFGPESKVEQKFGRSLKDNYGVGEGLFLNVARSYWTYKLEFQELRDEALDSLLFAILSRVEGEIGGVFFPTRGPASMPIEVTIATQEQIFSIYAPRFDFEKYVTENPMLNNQQSKGGFFKKVASLFGSS